jgi:hypothetical protein
MPVNSFHRISSNVSVKNYQGEPCLPTGRLSNPEYFMPTRLRQAQADIILKYRNFQTKSLSE